MSWISRDGVQPRRRRLAVGDGEPVVLDVRTQRVLVRRSTRRRPVLCGLRYSADGRTLLAAVARPDEGAADVVRYDARSGRLLGPGGRQRKGLSERDAHAATGGAW